MHDDVEGRAGCVGVGGEGFRLRDAAEVADEDAGGAGRGLESLRAALGAACVEGHAVASLCWLFGLVSGHFSERGLKRWGNGGEAELVVGKLAASGCCADMDEVVCFWNVNGARR